MGMDAGDVKERLGAVISVKNKRIEELEAALREIMERIDAHSEVHTIAALALAKCGATIR